jgi:hypothetical protein
MITYTALAAKLLTNAAAVATAATAPVVTADIQALADLLTILAADKSLGTPPLLKSTTGKAQLNPT